MNLLKSKAIKLRRAGYSYSMIRERIGIQKSTLSNWLNDIEFFPNKELVARVGEAKLKSALFKQKLKLVDKEQRKKEAENDIGILSERDLFMLGIGLYLGEGSKANEQVRIVNSDPVVIKLAISWFKKCCNLDIKNFKITIHDYPDNDIENNKRFWSERLNIPLDQFSKSILDRRVDKSTMNKRKLPYGTAHLYIRKGDTALMGVKSLHRKITGWIESSIKQI